jgi:hypothetical protein
MTEGYWRNLTARKMPWRTRAGQLEYPTPDHAVRVGTDPLSGPAPLPKWKVPGPLAAIVRLGSEEYQAIGTEGSWVVCICASDGRVTRMDRLTYEIAAGLRKPPQPEPCLITVQVNGQQVPLDRCDWVLWGPCGCPEGLHVAASGRKVHAADEETAWERMFDTKRERDKARRGGYRLELMSHERYGRDVLPLIRAECLHRSEPAGQKVLPGVTGQ